jgi:4-amino-4-deoxychorismate lyase
VGITFDLTLKSWKEDLAQIIKRDNLYEGGIKAILSGGPAPRGLAEQGYPSKLVFQSFNYTASKQPLRLLSSRWLRDGANPIYQWKTVNYLEAIIAKRQAQTLQADDILFFNMQHYATETTTDNIFLVKDNKLFTPSLNNGVLPGITRSRLLELSIENNISCLEANINTTMLEEADALFVTNALQGIRYILSWDKIIFEVRHSLVEELRLLL